MDDDKAKEGSSDVSSNTGQNPAALACSECQTIFKTAKNLKVHIARSLCRSDRPLVTEAELRRWKVKANLYRCPNCKKIYDKKPSFRRHLESQGEQLDLSGLKTKARKWHNINPGFFLSTLTKSQVTVKTLYYCQL